MLRPCYGNKMGGAENTELESETDLRVLVTVFAHNEEKRIAACLNSLPNPRDDEGLAVIVVVNGSSDRTAEIVRAYADRRVQLREYSESGKSRSWNRFVLDEAISAETYVFCDGDAEFAPGTVAALERTLAQNPAANGVAGLPLNGRRMRAYQKRLRKDRGMFGDCYALRGSFVERMRQSGLRLPEDLIGDDGLIAALVRTDLQDERNWDRNRVVICEDGGFYCEPNRLNLAGIRRQLPRMRSYSERHMQNQIVRAIMRGPGPQALPERLSDCYDNWIDQLKPRGNPIWRWFDRQTLMRMRGPDG